MKRHIFSLLLLFGFTGVTCNAQTQVASYHSDYFGADFYVEATNPGRKGDFKYFIQVASADAYLPEVNISMKKQDAKKFIVSLKRIKRVYRKRAKQAIKEHAAYQSTRIDILFPKVNAGFKAAGEWVFARSAVSPIFVVRDGKYLLVLQGQPIAADGMSNNGYQLVFESKADFDSFINSITPSTTKQYFKNSESSNKKG